MSQSSFYGGRPGVSFKIVKHFDGIDIPQNTGSIVYKKKIYAVRTIENREYFIYPFIEQTGQNHDEYDWAVCALDGQRKDVVYSDNTTGTEAVSAVRAEGMVQCFKQGGATTNEVNYGEYVIIDTIKDMCDGNNPENGMLFRRGTNLNYNASTNPYYGGEYIGSVRGSQGSAGSKGPKGDKGDPGPRGEKGDTGSYNILGIYATSAEIPDLPPEEIMEDESYRSWDILVGDVTDPNEDYHLFVYDYLNEEWVDVGSFLGNSGEDNSNYTVCYTLGDVAAKTANLAGFVLKTGAKLIVKFEEANTAANPTLNVSNTGAKPLVANGESAEDIIIAGAVFLVIYDGTNYILVGGAGTGSENDFIGTTAEWNALTTAQKEKYADGIVFITDDGHGTSGGDSGGHIIVNSVGAEMTQRNKLKFVGATVSDSSASNSTIVTIETPEISVATDSTPGIVQPDDSTIVVDENGIISAVPEEIPIATTAENGILRPDGTSITITNEGVISATPGSVPIATSSSLGIIKPDNTSITVNNQGVISATPGSVPIATSSSLGIVKPDNDTIKVDGSGVIRADIDIPEPTPIATSSTVGTVKPDNATIAVDANGVLSVIPQADYTVSEIVIAANGWNSSTNEYSLESTYPSNQYDILNLVPCSNTTDTQRTAWANAKCGGYYSTNVMKAYGTVPTIDIRLAIYVKAKDN